MACLLDLQPHHLKDRLTYGYPDRSRPHRVVFEVVTAKSAQVIDQFHVMRPAISVVDEVCRRVQQRCVGHRRRRDDTLYGAP